MPAAVGRVAREGAEADPGGACDQRHGGQAEQSAPVGNPVERQVVESRAGDQDQEEDAGQQQRQLVAALPPPGHVRSTSTRRRARTSTGWPREIRSTTKR